MDKIKEMNLKEIMQISHDMEQFQSDIGMFLEFMDAEEVKTILKKDE